MCDASFEDIYNVFTDIFNRVLTSHKSIEISWIRFLTSAIIIADISNIILTSWIRIMTRNTIVIIQNIFMDSQNLVLYANIATACHSVSVHPVATGWRLWEPDSIWMETPLKFSPGASCGFTERSVWKQRRAQSAWTVQDSLLSKEQEFFLRKLE